jgi:HlyD family secretion protein
MGSLKMFTTEVKLDELKTEKTPLEPRRPKSASAPVSTRPKDWVKWVWIGTAVLVLAVAGITTWLRSSSKVKYVTAVLDRGEIESTVTTSGSLNAVITVQVGSQVSGNILALYADFNTKVKKGQMVAQIDPAPFQAAVDQVTASVNASKAGVLTASAMVAKAESDLANAQASIANQRANVVKAQSAADLAKVENERRKVMLAGGITSQSDADTVRAAYDQSLANVDAAKATLLAAQASAESARRQIEVTRNQTKQAEALVEQGKAALAQAQLNLSHTRIVAPVDGTVQSRNMDVGQTVAASFQSPTIFLIAQDMAKMQVDTNLDESDIGRIHLDQKAQFTVDAWPGQTFHGRVWQIRQAPINVLNVITYNVVIQVSNADLKLFPGMTANTTISVGHATNALRLPKAALRFHPTAVTGKPSTAGRAQPGQTAYVLGADGNPRAVPIRTGISDANYVELVSGDLQEGTQVVLGMSTPTAAKPPVVSSSRRTGI